MSADFFPVPMPDETTYSLLSRYHVLSGSHSPVWSRRNLGLDDCASVVSALPRHVTEILAALPPNYSIASALDLIEKHTILPYFLFFRGRDDRENILDVSQGGGSWTHLLGMIACRGHELAAEHSFPAYCQSCVREDLNVHGFSYWRRTHQLPSVRVCPWHHEPLHLACIHFYRNGRRFQGFCLPDQASQTDDPNLVTGFTDSEVDGLLDLANWSHRILVAGKPLMAVDPRPFFRTAIKRNGYQKKGRRDLPRLSEDIRCFYGKQIADELGLMGNHRAGKLWLAYATQTTSTNAQHTLRYLLLGKFLFGTFERMIDEAGRYGLSARGTSAALPVWAEQLPELVAKYGALSKAAVHVGSNFLKVRAVAEQLGIKSAKRSSIVTPETRQAILACLKDGEAVDKVAKRFYVSECTVRDLLARNPEYRAARDVVLKSVIRVKHRTAVETRIVTHPHTTRTSLRRVLPSACNWLLKHDREWFFACLPHVKRQKHEVRKRSKEHWDRADLKSAQKVREVVKELSATLRPVWLSKNRILMTAKIAAWFFRNQQHLPKTSAVLNTSVETLSKFHERKIRWGIKTVSNQGLVYNQTALIAVTGMDGKALKKFENLICEEMQRYPFLNRKIQGDRQSPVSSAR